MVFKLTTDVLGSSKILCLIDLYLKDDRGSFNHLTKVKDDFTLCKVKVSLKMFSNHHTSVIKRLTSRAVLFVRRPGSFVCIRMGWDEMESILMKNVDAQRYQTLTLQFD